MRLKSAYKTAKRGIRSVSRSTRRSVKGVKTTTKRKYRTAKSGVKLARTSAKVGYWTGTQKTKWASGMRTTKVKAKNIFKPKRQPSLAELGFFSGLGGATGGAIGGSIANRKRRNP